MNANEQLATAFEDVIAKFNNSPGMRRFRDGNITKAHYAALLREVYFYARENPQLQAGATLYFQGQQREMVKDFLRHATSEIGHDQLALNDMEALGFDTTGIKEGRPLPSTMALTAFPYYQITGKNAVGYLGYLYFLEFMPVRSGAEYIAGLTKLQVPFEATTFLQDHSVIDVGHTKAMTKYADTITTCQRDIDDVIYAMRVTGELYSTFVERTFQSVDAEGMAGEQYGVDQPESSSLAPQRASKTPTAAPQESVTADVDEVLAEEAVVAA